MASKRFDVAAHFGENLAAKYDRRIRRFCPSYDALHHMIAPWLQQLPENADFLSAGAGVGAEIVTLAERFPFWRFAAVDVSPEMIGACRHRLAEAGMTDRVDFFHGRLQDYRSPASFHAASSIFVAHFIKGRKEKLDYFSSIAANLEPGGLLVVADLFGDRNSFEFARLLNAWLLSYASHGISAEELALDRAHVEKDVDFIPESDLLSILKDAGFESPLKFYQTYLFGGWVVAKSK
jgi:tRNA (cmo5U34)-methyltransferase